MVLYTQTRWVGCLKTSALKQKRMVPSQDEVSWVSIIAPLIMICQLPTSLQLPSLTVLTGTLFPRVLVYSGKADESWNPAASSIMKQLPVQFSTEKISLWAYKIEEHYWAKYQRCLERWCRQTKPCDKWVGWVSPVCTWVMAYSFYDLQFWPFVGPPDWLEMCVHDNPSLYRFC